MRALAFALASVLALAASASATHDGAECPPMTTMVGSVVSLDGERVRITCSVLYGNYVACLRE